MAADAPQSPDNQTELPVTASLVYDCPLCEQQLNSTLWQIVDLALYPHMRRLLVERTLHEVSCVHCESIHRFNPAFVVWEPLGGQLLGFHEESQDPGFRMRLEHLADSLRNLQSDAVNVPLLICATPGELISRLLEGDWSLCVAAGFEHDVTWERTLALLPDEVRSDLVDLLLGVGYPSMLELIQDDVVIGAALHLANDEDSQQLQDVVRNALHAIIGRSAMTCAILIDAILPALAFCSHTPPVHEELHHLLDIALQEAVGELSLVELERDASVLFRWSGWIFQHSSGVDRAITLYDLADGVFDRLNTQQYSGALGDAVRGLFAAVIAADPSSDLMWMARERLGELRLLNVVSDVEDCEDMRRAARQFGERSHSFIATHIWIFLMRWLAIRVDGQGRFTEVDAALEAGKEGLACASLLPLKNVLTLSAEIADIATRMPGKGSVARQAWAIQIYHVVLQKSNDSGTSKQASVRLNIANALLSISADNVTNVEEAISVLSSGGQLLPLFAECGLRRTALSVLARAYRRRVTGKKATNLENAVSCYRQALTQDSPATNDPIDTDEVRGTIQSNLGNALMSRVSGDRRKNLVEALSLYMAVEAEQRSMNAVAQLQARTWLAIGNAIYEIALLENPPHKNRLRRSIIAYGKACELFDPLIVPAETALALMLLGQAKSFAISSNKDFATTVDYYRQADELAAQAGDLALQESIAARHGSLLFFSLRFPEAVSIYTQALNFRYRLMAEATSGLTRQHQLTAIAPYGARLAYVLILNGQLDNAIDVLHSVRALELRAALQGVQSLTDSIELVRYREARAKLLSLEFYEQSLNASAIAHEPNDASIDPREAFGRLHQQLQEARNEVQQAQQALSLIGVNDALSGYRGLAADVGADELLVMPIITDVGSLIVFATSEALDCSDDSVVSVDGTRLFDIQIMMGERVSLDEYAQTLSRVTESDVDLEVGDETAPSRSWRQIVASVAAARSNAERAEVVSWMDEFFATLGRTAIMEAIFKRLAETGKQRLRLVGLGALQSLPFSMALDHDSQLPLMFKTSVTTQVGLMNALQITGIEASRPRVLIVADPQDNLPLARWEAAMIVQVAANYADVELLQGSDATSTALLERIGHADVLHFAGHAVHDAHHPGHSRLICADGALSIQALVTTTKRTPLKLVVLSACNTHHIDSYRLPDEFVGLPGAFFALGVETVISSMWPVSDEATAVLMAEFYRQMLEEQNDCAQALACAQRHLANGTALQLRLADRLELYNKEVRLVALDRRILGYRRRPDIRPFAHSVYWGAQVCQVC
ncbi:CHAT domain-containing protein [Pseudomonas sp. XS1P51]